MISESTQENLLRPPPRNPAHADPDWFQRGLDDQIEDPDSAFVDPLPTVRHRTVPGFPSGGHQPKPAAFSPLDVSALSGWFDGMDDSTFTLAGSAISQWRDKSPNANHADQSDSSLRPERETDKVVCNGDWLGMSVPTATSASFAVLSNIKGSFGDSTFVTPIISDNASEEVFVAVSGDYTVSIDGNLEVTSITSQGDASMNGGALVPGDGSLGDIPIPGYVPYPTSSEINILFTQWPRNGKSVGINRLGHMRNNPARRLVGELREIILLNAVPSQADRQKLEGYLAHKWGLVSKLPSNHPFKTEAPFQ